MITEQDFQKSKEVFEAWMNLTPEEHHQMIYEAGLERLDILAIPGSSYHRKLEGSKQYWRWFARDWNTKNLQSMYEVGIHPFELPEFKEAHVVQALKDAHHHYHNEVITYSKPIFQTIK